MRFEQETIVPGDVTIGSRIDEAETKATHYMTDTTNGVKVHPDNDTANYVLIQNGMEIFRNNVSVANYGAITRIGRSDKAHILIDNSKVNIFGYTTQLDLAFGAANDPSTGIATIVEHCVVTDGTSAQTGDYVAETNYSINSIVSCELNGQVVSNVEIVNSHAIAAPEFQVGDLVVLEYTTMDEVIFFQSGALSTATGPNSAAFGYHSTASGVNSFAQGANSTASGSVAHAEGSATASGEASHAEGQGSIASGQASHAQNVATIAEGDAQTALGRFNIADKVNAIILGNGSYSNRSNALTVDWNGNVTCGTVNGVDLTAISGASIETIADWNTAYDSSKPVRYLFGNNATNTPASGAQIVGIELNNAANNRMQMGFRVGSGTSNSFFVRHAPNGTWGTWTEFGGAPTSTSTGINGINAVKNGTGTAMLYFANFSFAANTGTDSTAYRLPAGLRPPVTLDLVSTHNNVRFFITTDGYIRPAVATTAATAIRGTFTFLAS